MLQSVRKYTEGWIATVVGIILSLAFLFWGVENYLLGSNNKNILAKVNGQKISNREVQSDFERMILRFKEQFGANINLPTVMQQQLKQQVLRNLIMQNVLVQSAQKAGLHVTNLETAKMIKQMPIFQSSGYFSKESFNLVMNKMGYTQQQFFNDVSKTLMLNQVASGIIGSAFLLPNELNQAIALSEQKRDIEYVVLTKAKFMAKKPIASGLAQHYYQQHKSNFTLPAKIQLEYLELSLQDLKKDITVTPSDLASYFDLNSAQDRNNKLAIENAKTVIARQKAEQAFLAANDQLTDLTYTNPNSLRKAAEVLGLTVKTTDFFSSAGGNTLFTKNPKIIAAAFNPNSLNNHTNSPLIELASGRVVVIRIKSSRPETFAPYRDVQAKINVILQDKQATLNLEEKVASFSSRIKNNEKIANIASKAHLALVTKSKVTRHEKAINSEILKLAFAAPFSDKQPIVNAKLANGDYVFLVVKNSVNFSIDQATAKMLETTEKHYSDTYGKVEYNLYGENQLAHAKIKLFKTPN